MAGKVREDPPVAEASVGRDLERHQPVRKGFGNDQDLSVRRHHHPVGARQVVRDISHRAVGFDQEQHRRGRRLAMVEVEADVADMGAAGGQHDHVVALGAMVRRQIAWTSNRLLLRCNTLRPSMETNSRLPSAS